MPPDFVSLDRQTFFPIFSLGFLQNRFQDELQHLWIVFLIWATFRSSASKLNSAISDVTALAIAMANEIFPMLLCITLLDGSLAHSHSALGMGGLKYTPPTGGYRDNYFGGVLTFSRGGNGGV